MPQHTDNQRLKAELLYKAGDIRTLALQFPDHAQFLIAVGDLVDAAAGTLPATADATDAAANVLAI